MCFSVEMKCTACGESTDKWHDASLSETAEDRTGHANVHYSAKCKLCAREYNLSKFYCIVRKKNSYSCYRIESPCTQKSNNLMVFTNYNCCVSKLNFCDLF